MPLASLSGRSKKKNDKITYRAMTKRVWPDSGARHGRGRAVACFSYPVFKHQPKAEIEKKRLRIERETVLHPLGLWPGGSYSIYPFFYIYYIIFLFYTIYRYLYDSRVARINTLKLKMLKISS